MVSQPGVIGFGIGVNEDTRQLVYVTAAHCTTDATGCSATGPPGQSYFHRGPLDNGCSLLGLLNIGALADQAFPTLGDNVDAAVIASNDMQTSSPQLLMD